MRAMAGKISTLVVFSMLLLFSSCNAHNHIARIHSNSRHPHRLSVTVHATAKPAPAPEKAAPAPEKAAPAPTKAAPAPAADAPAAVATPPPPPLPTNLTSVMAKKSCKSFADLLLSTGDAAATFQSSVDGGITIFCPSDSAVKGFMSKFKNLTVDAKLSLLLFHAVPVYYSMSDLKSSNGVMNTLATDGTAKNFNFTVQNDGDHITLKTAADSPAKITGTVFDKEPVSIFSVNSILQPQELFAPVEAPAPAPSSVADAPRASKGKKNKKHQPVADAPGPDSADSADQKAADDNDGFRVAATRWFGTAGLMALIAAVLV